MSSNPIKELVHRNDRLEGEVKSYRREIESLNRRLKSHEANSMRIGKERPRELRFPAYVRVQDRFVKDDAPIFVGTILTYELKAEELA